MRILLLFVVSIFLTGCVIAVGGSQPNYIISVDSLASKQAIHHKNYFLLPGNENVSVNDLQFQEFSTYVEKMLLSKGYAKADSKESADLVIVLSYGIGDPKTHHYSYTLPTWGKTGVSSAYTYGTSTTSGNTTTTAASTTLTPQYGVTGYQSKVGTRVTYNKYAFLTAYDYSEYKISNREIQLWKTSISNEGLSSDLRLVFPYLIAASSPYAGINTYQRIDVSINVNDKVVKDFKGKF